MSDKAFLVDTSKCTGCRACQVACKQWKGLPAEDTKFFEGSEYTNPANLSAITWNHVKFYPIDRSNEEKPIWTIEHRKCFHCKDANCLRVCPEKAISKVDGWTVIDQSKCIGCGACVNACVYDVPHISEKTYVSDLGHKVVVKDKSYKCNADTSDERGLPACVVTCPTGALQYGERLALVNKSKERVAQLKKEGFSTASVYGLEQFGGLRVLTVFRDDYKKYGLPENPELVPITKVEATKDVYALLSGFTFGVPFLKRTAYKMSKSLSKES